MLPFQRLTGDKPQETSCTHTQKGTYPERPPHSWHLRGPQRHPPADIQAWGLAHRHTINQEGPKLTQSLDTHKYMHSHRPADKASRGDRHRPRACRHPEAPQSGRPRGSKPLAGLVWYQFCSQNSSLSFRPPNVSQRPPVAEPAKLPLLGLQGSVSRASGFGK